MKSLFKIIVFLVIIVVFVSSIYTMFLANAGCEGEAGDIEPPRIDFITGDTTGVPGKITTITVGFSDNVNVTKAVLYYKAASADGWSEKSILNRSTDIEIPMGSVEDWYYYVIVDDAAGNGPVGSPSNDGSKYYVISVKEEEVDLVHYVFVEEGTATWCHNCPDVANILHELYESGEYKFYYVSMIQDKNSKAKDRLEKEYNILGYPTCFFDGGYEVVVGDNAKSVFEEKLSRASKRQVPPLYLNVTADVDVDKKNCETSVLIRNYGNTTYNGRLRVYLTERNSYQYYGGEGVYHFGFIDYIINEDVEIPMKGEKTVTKTYDVSSFDIDNLMIIAVIFNNESVKKYANPPDENPFDAYYADAADGTLVGEGGYNLPPEVGITNPKNGKLHLFGREIITTLGLKTILLGRTWITAQASDDSKVVKVEFYVDDKLVAEFTEPPYEWLWKTPSWFKCRHEIKVIAYDDTGKTSTATMDVIAFILL